MCSAVNGLWYGVISFFPQYVWVSAAHVPINTRPSTVCERVQQKSVNTSLQQFFKHTTCTKPFPHLEVVYLFIGALLFWSVFQHGPSHQRWGDLRTGGQQFNGLPQKCPFASQPDSQSQSQQLLTLPLVSSSLVGDQLSSQTPSAFLSLHTSPFGFPQTLHLLRGKSRGGGNGQTLPATARRRSSRSTPAHQGSTQEPDWWQVEWSWRCIWSISGGSEEPEEWGDQEW